MSRLNNYVWHFRGDTPDKDMSFESVGEDLQHAFLNLTTFDQKFIKQQLIHLPPERKSIKVNGHRL